MASSRRIQDDDIEYPRRRRKKRQSGGGGMTWLIISVALGLPLIAGAVVLVVVLTGQGDGKKKDVTSHLPKVKSNDPVNLPAGLKEVLDELDRTDPDWRLPDLEAKRTTPEPNSGELVLAAGKLLPEKWNGNVVPPTAAPDQPLAPFEI